MKPDYEEALRLMHIPACVLRRVLQDQIKSAKSKKEAADVITTAKEVDASESAQVYQAGYGLEALILCENDECRFVDAAAVEEEEKQKKRSKKKKKKKQNREKEEERQKTEQDLQELVGTDTTVLLDRHQMKKGLPQGAVEIGTIAETEPEEETDLLDPGVSNNNKQSFIGPFHLTDDSLPDILLKVHEKLATPPPSAAECAEAKPVNWDAFTSTWLSVSAKGIDIRESVEHLMEPLTAGQPKRYYHFNYRFN